MSLFNYHDQLKEIGLSEKESKVYLAALELGPAAVQKIAERAGVKRPTTYVMLEALAERGLMTTTKEGKRTRFAASSPEKIMAILEAERHRAATRLESFRTALPGLMTAVESFLNPRVVEMAREEDEE